MVSLSECERAHVHVCACVHICVCLCTLPFMTSLATEKEGPVLPAKIISQCVSRDFQRRHKLLVGRD